MKEHTVNWVPGSFELPVVAQKLAKSGRFDAVVCLGCVVRHETDHYRYIAGEAERRAVKIRLRDVPAQSEVSVAQASCSRPSVGVFGTIAGFVWANCANLR